MGKYTEEQLAVIKHGDGNLLVKAVPGSGKTRSMIGRVHYLISQKKVALHDILVLTFGRDTSENFRNKLAEKNIPSSKQRLRDTVRVCTFHSFALRELNQCVRNQGIPSFDTDQARRGKILWKYFKSHIDQYNASTDGGIKGDAFQEIFGDYKNWVACQKADSSNFTFKEKDLKKVFELAYRDFEKERLQSQIRANDDWIPDLVEIVSKDTTDLPTYKYVLVDEYQDSNKAQNQILKKLSGDGSWINAVGDEDQTIYSWRGSQPAFMNDHVFAEQFDNPSFYTLSITFRFGHSVSLIANSLIRQNKSRSDKICISHDTTPKSSVKLIQDNNTSRALIDLIKDINKKRALEDICILNRTNANVLLVQMILRFHDIPYKQTLATYDKLNDQMVCSISLITNLLVSKDFFPVTLTGNDRSNAARSMLVAMTAYVKTETINKLTEIITNQNPIAAISLIARAGTETNNKHLIEFSDNLNSIFHEKETFDKASSCINHVINKCNTKNAWQKSNLTSIERNHVERWQDALVDSLSFMDIDPTFAIRKLIEKPQSNDEGINVMSCHRAKGLEYPVVIIPELHDTQFPCGKFDLNVSELDKAERDEIEEERRLFYVAITRTQEDLYLISPSDKRIERWQDCDNPTSYPKNGNMSASRFVFESNIEKMSKFADGINQKQEWILESKNYLMKRYIAKVG